MMIDKYKLKYATSFLILLLSPYPPDTRAYFLFLKHASFFCTLAFALPDPSTCNILLPNL